MISLSLNLFFNISCSISRARARLWRTSPHLLFLQVAATPCDNISALSALYGLSSVCRGPSFFLELSRGSAALCLLSSWVILPNEPCTLLVCVVKKNKKREGSFYCAHTRTLTTRTRNFRSCRREKYRDRKVDEHVTPPPPFVFECEEVWLNFAFFFSWYPGYGEAKNSREKSEREGQEK